jgi:hypothetical protein
MDIETLIQLGETSLKMGFGALIAVFSGWFMLRRSANLSNAPRENRRLQILEEVSSQVGAVTHVFAKYSTLVVESIQLGDQWHINRKMELDAVNIELAAEFKKLADAEAKLLMIGEKNLERSLRMYAARVAQFRKNVYVGRTDLTNEQINALKQSIFQVREQFYDFLSRKYDRLLADA